MQPTRSYNYIWPTPEDLEFVIDNRTLKAQPPLPTGPPGLALMCLEFKLFQAFFLYENYKIGNEVFKNRYFITLY